MRNLARKTISLTLIFCVAFSLGGAAAATDGGAGEPGAGEISRPTGRMPVEIVELPPIELPVEPSDEPHSEPSEEPSEDPGLAEVVTSPTPYLMSSTPTGPAETESLYHYNLLNDKQKTVYKGYYDLISQRVAEGQIDLDFSLGVTDEDVMAALLSCSYDHPELYWSVGSYMRAHYEDSDVVGLILLPDETKAAMPMTAENAQADAERMRAAAATLLAPIPTDDPPAVTALKIHDALAAHVTYDYAALDNVSNPLPHSAYKALTEGLAVCDGYAKAYAYLLKQRGITAAVVPGLAYPYNSNTDGHAWNIVRLGSDWYEVDVTWDDQTWNGQQYTIYDYFNLTTAELYAGHYEDDGHLRDDYGLGEILPIAEGTHFTKTYLNAAGTTLAAGMGPDGQPISLAVLKDGALKAINSERALTEWTVKIARPPGTAYSEIDSLIWNAQISLKYPDTRGVELTSSWTRELPQVTVAKMARPHGPISVLDASIIFDNGALGSTTGNMEVFVYAAIGDLNGNGIRDVRDTVLLKQYLDNVAELDEAQLFEADITYERVVDAADLNLLLSYIAEGRIART